MRISYLSEDKRGPGIARQRLLIEEAGIVPDKEMVGEEDLKLMPLWLKDGDEIVIAHSKAFIGPRASSFVLEMAKGIGAKINVVGDRIYDPQDEGDFDKFLVASAKRWKKFGRTGPGSPPQGRPREYKAPNGETLRMLKRMWWRPRNAADPDGFSAKMVLDVASDSLGFEVERHHVKHWISDLRQKPEDGLARIERKK